MQYQYNVKQDAPIKKTKTLYYKIALHLSRNPYKSFLKNSQKVWDNIFFICQQKFSSLHLST